MRRSLHVALLVLVCSCAGPLPPGPEEPVPAAPDAPAAAAAPRPAAPNPALRDPREVHLSDIVQLTNGGENAEAYWSFDGTQLIFQSKRPPYQCDQILRMPADGSAPPRLVSTGKGATTCSYFLPGDKEILYASTHEKGPECPPPPDHSQGYVWALHDHDIYRANADGGSPRNLTRRPGYDAEATVCPIDGSIIFTSDRDGDLDLYRMDANGENVTRLTSTPGYDGGAFFSADCAQIVWRASRPTGDALADYKRLLGQNLVRPSQLELYVASADGSNARQITYLGAAAFGPFFHPSGKRILFSTNYPNPRGREFDIWAVNVDGSELERITFSEGFDGFPMFSPDGTRLAFASNRHNAKEGETNVFVARWFDRPDQPGGAPAEARVATAADRFIADVRWLADDAREGRGVTTEGLAQAGDWLAARLAEIGAEGAADAQGGYKQPLDVTVELARTPETALSIDGKAVDAAAFVPLSQSASASARGQTVFAGFGIVSKEHGIDDYKGLNARGKIAVVRRFVPKRAPFDDKTLERRFSDLQYKAFVARQKGARALIVVDVPEGHDARAAATGGELGENPYRRSGAAAGAAAGAPAAAETPDAPLPALAPAGAGDTGIPVVIVTRAAGAALVQGKHTVDLRVGLEARKRAVHNIVARIRAGAASKLPGAIVIGAHYDHLGHGGAGSLEAGEKVIHNGADDNASGTAALLEVARQLATRRDQLARDVYLVAFTAEETGVIGSRYFTQNPPPGLRMADVRVMLNMDMVGRMRDNRVSVMGTKTALELDAMVSPLCAAARLECTLGGDGYGPSDHMPFYTAGVPVLFFFTGAHIDYHRGSDDADRINAAGGARVAGLVAQVAEALATRAEPLTFQRAPMPEARGDVRSTGGSLGTVPAYGEEGGKPGVLLADVRAGGPADQAGVRGGDRVVAIDDVEIRSVSDLMFVLRQATPGQKAVIKVMRDGKLLKLEAVYGAPSQRMGR